MKITLQNGDDELTLTNDDYDNYNYLDLIIKRVRVDGDPVKGYESQSMQIDIDDLYSALSAFMVQRDLDNEQEKLYK